MVDCFISLRGKYLFRPLEHNEEITQEFFRKLYPSIITDITVSSVCVCVCVCMCVCVCVCSSTACLSLPKEQIHILLLFRAEYGIKLEVWSPQANTHTLPQREQQRCLLPPV